MKVDRPIAIGVILIIVLVVSFYLVLPRYREFKELRSKITTREAELEAREEYFAQVRDTYQRLVENKENIEKIKSALPDEPSVPAMVYFLQEKTEESGMVLDGFNLQQAAPGTRAAQRTKVKKTGFSLKLKGTYKSFRVLLEKLEKSSRLIEVEDISFGSLEEISRPSSEEEAEGEREQQQGQGEEQALTRLREFDLKIYIHSY